MESILPFFFSISALIIFTKIFLKRKSCEPLSETKQSLPPGPWRLPLVGNIHNIVSMKPPHHRLRDLANEYGQLMYLQVGEVPHIVVSSPEMAKEIMKTHDVNFAQRPRILLEGKNLDKGIIFGAHDEHWRLLKKICTEELLSPKRVQSFRPTRGHEVSNFIADLCSNSGIKVNLSSKIHSLTFLITARAAFGMKYKDHDLFARTITEVFRLARVYRACDIFPSQKWLHWIDDIIRPELGKLEDTVYRVLEGIVLERMASPETENVGCLLDVLLDIQKNGKLAIPLDTESIKAVLLDMFVAGGETSSVVIEWAMVEMLKNPRVMEKAQSEVRSTFGKQGHVDEGSLHELKFINMVIKETLRLHPPGALVPREAKESCVIDGYDIPSKTRVAVNVWAIGRDPRYWHDAETFFPERFIDSSVDFKGTSFEFTPFGAGRRICPGIRFGITEIELVLAQLLFHFDWKLPDGVDHENLDMTESFGMTLRRKEELLVIPLPYNRNPNVII